MIKLSCPKCYSKHIVEECTTIIQYQCELVERAGGELDLDYGNSEVLYDLVEPLDYRFYCKDCGCSFNFDLTTKIYTIEPL